MLTVSSFSSTLPAQTGFIDNIILISVGFSVVLIVLGVLALITELLGRFFRYLDKQIAIRESREYSALSSKKKAIITAAVDTVIDKPHRIRSIK